MKNFLGLLLIIFLASCGGKNAETVDTSTTPATQTATTKPQPTPRVAQQPQSRPAPRSVSASDYKAKNEGWHVDLEKAFSESQKTGKPILANFTGSDWCGWCKRLDKSVFHKPDFAKWADKNVVLLELDFPRRFKLPEEIATQNRGLQQSFGVRGYPTIWLFDLSKDDAGKFAISALGKTGYTKTVEEFTSTMGRYMEQRG